MSFVEDLLTGVAQYLEDGLVGTWKPAGDYLPTDLWPIIISAVPASPDQVIVLTPYGVSDDATLSDSVQGLQVRLRGTRDPRPVLAVADAVFARLQGAHGLTLSTGVRLVQAQRSSAAALGVDGNGRHQRTENFYLDVHRPSMHRI